MIRSTTLEKHPDATTGNRRTPHSVLRGSEAPYLVALFVTPVVTHFAQYIFPGVAVVGAQPLSVVLAFAGVSVVLVLWFLYTPQQSWPPLFQVFIGALVLACFLASGITEDVVDWRYFGLQAAPFLLAAMLGTLLAPQSKGPPL